MSPWLLLVFAILSTDFDWRGNREECFTIASIQNVTREFIEEIPGKCKITSFGSQ